MAQPDPQPGARPPAPDATVDPRLTAENPPTETPPAEANATRAVSFSENERPGTAWTRGSLIVLAVVVLLVVIFLVAKIFSNG